MKFNHQTIVFTDGSVINNGKPDARGGIGVYFSHQNNKRDNRVDNRVDNRNISEPFLLRPITNIRSELYAVIRAIQNYAQNSDWNIATHGFKMWKKDGYMINRKGIKPQLIIYKKILKQKSLKKS